MTCSALDVACSLRSAIRVPSYPQGRSPSGSSTSGDIVSLVRIQQFAVSFDGYATGEGQSLETPFGHVGGG
jgi:hypothetical protein